MMKKLLFLSCFLGIFSPARAMHPDVLKNTIKTKEWGFFVDRMVAGSITVHDLSTYTKNELDQLDGEGGTLCEYFAHEAGWLLKGTPKPEKQGDHWVTNYDWQIPEESKQVWDKLELLVAMDKLTPPNNIAHSLQVNKHRMSKERAQMCQHMCEEIRNKVVGHRHAIDVFAQNYLVDQLIAYVLQHKLHPAYFTHLPSDLKKSLNIGLGIELVKLERSDEEKRFITSLQSDLKILEAPAQPQNPQPKHKTSFILGNGKYMIGVALLAVAGLLAYKYRCTSSQDEDDEAETEEDTEHQTGNINS
jgi:hypothetical protein